MLWNKLKFAVLITSLVVLADFFIVVEILVTVSGVASLTNLTRQIVAGGMGIAAMILTGKLALDGIGNLVAFKD